MDTKIDFTDSVNIKASVKISKDEIEKELNNEAKRAAKSMKIDGFRKGKVPVAVVIQRYKNELLQESEHTLLKRAVNSVLKDNKKDTKDLVSEPFFDKYDNKDGEINSSFVLSFKPSVKLGEYKGLVPTPSKPIIKDEDVDLRIKELLKKEASVEAIKEDRGLKIGDFAKFDFDGYIDDKAFEGGKANDYTLEIGSGQFIPGFEDGMLGLKVGEERDVKVMFPKEYGASELAGKEAVFKVKIHEIQELKIPELNDELIKKLLSNDGNPSEEKLRKRLKDQLEQEAMFKEIQEKLKPKLVEALVENIDFELPLSVVEQETDMQFRNSWRNIDEKEAKELSEDEKKYEEKEQAFKEDAEKSVKLTFIIDELARELKMSVSDEELMRAIYFEAYRYGVDPREHAKRYQEQGTLGALKMSILEDKLFAELFKEQKEKAEK